jgi:hypothetical protein
MHRFELVLGQALTAYAGVQLREVLGRVRSSVGTLDRTEQVAAFAALAVLASFLLRRGAIR